MIRWRAGAVNAEPGSRGAILPRMQVAHEAKVRFGPAGWSYDDWKGIVYPAGLPRATHPVALLRSGSGVPDGL